MSLRPPGLVVAARGARRPGGFAGLTLPASGPMELPRAELRGEWPSEERQGLPRGALVDLGHFMELSKCFYMSIDLKYR